MRGRQPTTPIPPRGLRLRELRRARGFRSQTRLAAAMDVDIHTVQQWERRGILPQDADQLARLASLLRCTMEYLVAGTGAADVVPPAAEAVD